MKMGAAVTIGDGRISESQLNTAVTGWQDAYKAHPLPAQQLSLVDPESTQRSVLAQLVTMKVSEQAAADNGIAVTPAQIDSAINEISRGGGQKMFDLIALSFGVPPSHTREFARTIVINNKLAAGATSEQQAQEKATAALLTTAKAMGIKINPRFGEFADGQFAPPVTLLSRLETGTQ